MASDFPSQGQQDVDLNLRSLGQFIGTEGYTNVFGVKVTDGVRYLMENGYSWFVTDSIVVLKIHKAVKAEEFVTVKLVLEDGNKGRMEMTDGNDKMLYIQKYEYTDAKRGLTLFYTDGVLLLSGEY